MAGGYQRPSNPAPVSGPGPLSKRTDGGPGQAKQQLPDAAYGEQKDFQSIQGGAPMAGGRPPVSVTGLGEPTQRPGEPVTHGSPSGPGGGPQSVGMARTLSQESDMDARQIASYLPALQRMANQPGVPKSFVRFVKYVREFAP
jgi:hypothetical protein